MTQQASNLRVRRTQKLLREALVELIEERGFEALTVGELTARALVSRAAFYRNYQDKYALVEQIFAEAMGALLGAVGELGSEHPPEVLVVFFEHIAEYERLYRALLGKRGSPWFVRTLRTSLTELVNAGRHHHPPNGQRPTDPRAPSFADELLPDLVAAMLVEAITWWLEQGRPYTPREMATRCSLLMSALFREVSGWQ